MIAAGIYQWLESEQTVVTERVTIVDDTNVSPSITRHRRPSRCLKRYLSPVPSRWMHRATDGRHRYHGAGRPHP